MLHTSPACLSIVKIRLFLPGTRSFDDTIFSTASTIPSSNFKPMAVPVFSVAFTAYSTWKFLPSKRYFKIIRFIDEKRSLIL